MDHHRDRSLADVLPSAGAALGLGGGGDGGEGSGFRDTLQIGASDVVVVLLVDGLGAVAIEQHLDLFPALRDARGGSIEAAFPTTTATGLATLGTGLPPGQHGILGAAFRLEGSTDVLSPLHWGSNPSPVAVQPEPTCFERLADLGVQCLAVGPAAYAGSGLTRAVLRGAQYRSAESMAERVDVVANAAAGHRPLLAYVYWPALDRAGHEFGVQSAQWRAAASDVDQLIDSLLDALPTSARLVVTADHGMVDAGERIWVEQEPVLTAGVATIAGEPRMRHIYCEVGQVAQVHARWSGHLAGRASVWTREAAIDAGWFGSMDPVLADRVGDLVVVCDLGTTLASRVADSRLSSLPGQHGGLSDEERRIPGLILEPV